MTRIIYIPLTVPLDAIIDSVSVLICKKDVPPQIKKQILGDIIGVFDQTMAGKRAVDRLNPVRRLGYVACLGFFGDNEIEKAVADSVCRLLIQMEESPGYAEKALSLMHDDCRVEAGQCLLGPALYDSFNVVVDIFCMPELIDYLSDLNENSYILDLACGSGLFGEQIRRTGFAGRLIGVDISEEMINCSRVSINYSQSIVGDMRSFVRKINFQPDLVTLIGAVHIVERDDIASFFKDIYDHLSPGGMFLTNHIDSAVSKNTGRQIQDGLVATGYSIKSAEMAGATFFMASKPDGSVRE